ncbi:hypothetical protein [Morganella morganii]|uniref:hypothetical protein n=1 Tax=Morganella morganii TaxID=582 RepID=UPI0034E46658
MTIEERLSRLESAVTALAMKQANREIKECQSEMQAAEKHLAELKIIHEQKKEIIKSGNYL